MISTYGDLPFRNMVTTDTFLASIPPSLAELLSMSSKTWKINPHSVGSDVGEGSVLLYATLTSSAVWGAK